MQRISRWAAWKQVTRRINFVHSLLHSFIHLIHSFTHSSIHSFIQSFTHSLLHSLTPSFTHSIPSIHSSLSLCVCVCLCDCTYTALHWLGTNFFVGNQRAQRWEECVALPSVNLGALYLFLRYLEVDWKQRGIPACAAFHLARAGESSINTRFKVNTFVHFHSCIHWISFVHWCRRRRRRVVKRNGAAGAVPLRRCIGMVVHSIIMHNHADAAAQRHGACGAVPLHHSSPSATYVATVIHSFIHSFIHSLIHSFMHSCPHICLSFCSVQEQYLVQFVFTKNSIPLLDSRYVNDHHQHHLITMQRSFDELFVCRRWMKCRHWCCHHPQ